MTAETFPAETLQPIFPGSFTSGAASAAHALEQLGVAVAKAHEGLQGLESYGDKRNRIKMHGRQLGRNGRMEEAKEIERRLVMADRALLGSDAPRNRAERRDLRHNRGRYKVNR